MSNGFIPSAELTDRPTTVDTASLANRLETVAGVLGASHIAIWVEDGRVLADGVYHVTAGTYCSLDAGLEAAVLPFEAWVDGQPVAVDRRQVVHLLRRLWQRHRALHPVKAALHEAWPAEIRVPRNLRRFAPIASQFPAVYALGDGIGTPDSAPARQLLGYLAIFEMMMVDLVDRLAGIAEPQPPSRQAVGGDLAALCASVPALAQLGVPLAVGGDTVFAREDDDLGRQERLTDFLLGLYGGHADTIPSPPRSIVGSPDYRAHRVARKRELLRRLLLLARRRGRGFDYGPRPALRRLSGVEQRSRVLLGHGKRHRLILVERMMLRPRTAERRAIEADRFAYGMTADIVLHLPRNGGRDPRYCREIAAMVRDETPAHVGLRLHFVDRHAWRRMFFLHKLWCEALRAGDEETIDALSIELRDVIDTIAEGDGR